MKPKTWFMEYYVPGLWSTLYLVYEVLFTWFMEYFVPVLWSTLYQVYGVLCTWLGTFYLAYKVLCTLFFINYFVPGL